METIGRGAGRYAPSPSGRLHIGNLSTALVAWLAARSTGRKFLVRIDNLDRDRDAGAGPAQLSDLKLLGLDWDEPAVWQADRSASYAAAVEKLTAAGLVFECFCSRKDILQAPTAPHAPPGAYPGTCRNLSAAEIANKQEQFGGRNPALRLRTPAPAQERSFTDALLGRVTGSVDDFVLRRGDGTYAYNLATVVDDAAAGVDQVVRGEDLALSTPRQLVLYDLLGLKAPEYAHVPLVLNKQGQRLAKRDGAVTLAELLELGINPSEVLSKMAESLGLSKPGEVVSATQLISRFEYAKLPKKPWIFAGL
ncbi:tRNA glutamyl-Q(34) synthetase GluQRS [Canibacter zhoujuaniae]|uniref:tRNA glutamyl-Q(34) synthetase GluQRS n=1 Tax=Canibacter zhoujuaniae TaxID=2708343 RepID=UPI0014200A8C|nr:tRNA glutamyl-Q(34) synthetase GluQRS [Canibacter zhoujuaniae]